MQTSTPLVIYNTLTGKKETFEPVDASHVKMYVCGPTVYNYIHIGNARPPVVFDVLFRVLQTQFPKVSYARNITDVDDKIMNAAAEQGVDISAITQEFSDAYREDVGSLNTLAPTMEPKATAHIQQMIEMVSVLINKGHAYEAKGNVFFDIKSFDEYGGLSKQNVDELNAGERIDVVDFKKHPADFVLWKPSVDDQIGWESPWGYGRPGWHLECSAMIEEHLGNTIDIHGGGRDLIFPHHENEIAQSTCAHGGEQYVKYWMHNGYITVDGEKMAKSLGNFKTIRDLLEHFDGEVIRYGLLSSHYRSPLGWTEDLLKQSFQSLDRIYTALRDFESLFEEEMIACDEAVMSALLDDINTPIAISHLHALVKQLNKADESESVAIAKSLIASARMLGLLKHLPSQWFALGKSDCELSEAEIDEQVAARQAAKKNKDFALADSIRQTLDAAGVVIEDTREGPRWSYKA